MRPTAPAEIRRGEHRQHDEGGEQERLLGGVRLRAQQQRDDQHRPELADRAGAEHEPPEPRVEPPGVAQDRDQRPERRRGHGRAHEQPGQHDARRGERARDRVGERERDQPAQDRQPQRRAADAVELDLVAREEEEEPEPELAEELEDLVEVREAEDVGADDRSQEQLDDDDGNDDPRVEAAGGVGDERRRGCGEEHEQEGGGVGHRDGGGGLYGSRGARRSPASYEAGSEVWLEAGIMERVERTLRRLALNDERSLRSALADPGSASDLDAKTQALIRLETLALIRLGALLSVGAATVSLRCTVELATAAGATDDEIVGVLLAIAPAVGHARVVGVAPHLGLALGYDFDA